MKRPFNLAAEIKLHLDDDFREGMKVTPSYYVLEAYASKLLELIERWKESEPDMADQLYSLQRKIDLFRVDLPGHLKDDLKKGNKRYRIKWLTLKDSIEAMKRGLLNLWKENGN